MNSFYRHSTIGRGAPHLSIYDRQALAFPMLPKMRNHILSSKPKALSALNVFNNILKKEGVLRLWSGLSPSLVMALPSTTLYFTAYDELKLAIEQDLPQSFLEPYVPLLAGSTSRAAAATLTSPLELIRTQMQSRKSTRGVVQSIKHEVGRNGILSLWRGLVPTLYRDVPFSGLYWLFYERTKIALRARLGIQAGIDNLFDEWKLAFFSGSIAGSIAAFVTTPFDVVKTRRQAVLSNRVQTKGKETTIFLLRRIIHQEGTSGLFSGLLPRLLKVSPACAIMISSYEFGKLLFVS